MITKDNYLENGTNTSIIHELPPSEKEFSIENFYKELMNVNSSWKDKDKKQCSLGIMLGRISKNKTDDRHYFKTFLELWIQHLINKYPEHTKRLNSFKEKMFDELKSLDDDIKISKVQQETMLPALLGMIEGLL